MSNTANTAYRSGGIAAERLWPAMAAILLGAFLILGVGFVGLPEIHNAAHDSRHTFAFPCH